MHSLATFQNLSKQELIQEVVKLQSENSQLQKKVTERRKEFQVLYKLSSLMENDSLSLIEVFQKTIDIIPSGWQYPEITCARIIFGKSEYKTANFKTSEWKQSEVISVKNNGDGTIEVFYTEKKQDEFEGPFLEEERDLLKVIAGRLGKMVTRKLLEEEFTTIFEESPVAKCIIDLSNDYRFTDVNNVFLNLTGYSRKEIIGKMPTQIGLFKDIRIVGKMLGDIARQGFIKNLEYEYITKDGQVKSTILNTKVIHINGRNLSVASFIDLTEIKKVQTELKKTEARYKSLVQSQTDIILRSDFEGKLTFANNSFCNTFGVNDEDIKNFNFLTTVFPEDVPKIQEVIRSLKQPPHKKYVEIRNITKRGVRWFGWDSMAVIDKEGNMVEFQGAGRDITNRIKNEEKIHASENLFKLIAKNVSDVIWMYNLTQDKYTYLSPSVEKLQGFTLEEVKRQTLIESISPQDRDKIIQLINENVNYFKEDDVPRTIINEVQLVSKDKGVVWAEVSSYLQKNNKGEIEIFGVSRNIDERKKAELKVHEHEIQLNSALKIAGLGYYIASGADANIDFIDEQTKSILGFSEPAKTPSLKNWLNNIHADDRDNVLAIHNEVFNGEKEAVAMVYKYHHPSIGVIWINHNVEVLQRNENHKTLKVFGVIQDITDRKINEQELIKAKEKAEESDRLKSAFLMNVSHEIRTPMNGILGFIDLMNEPDLNEEERRSFIDVVNKSGERLLNTINDIVEISKIEIGDIKLVNEEVNTEEIMRYHFNFFKLQADEKGIKLKISKLIKGKQAFIKIDKQKLDGILMNLIRNAIKFTLKGTVEIGNYIENDRFYFYVSDSGRGIPEDKLETIFDRFVQLELGNTRGYEGSGIGLSIVKAYIEALNGKIVVKSEVGKGSTFLFSVPYFPVRSKSKIMKKVEPDEIIPLKHTILVAEDDAVNFYFLENILSREFTVLHAENGEEALQLFKDNPEISLVLMDIKMPGNYDGLDATRIIRELNQQVPIIAQTAYAMEADKIKALDAGCNDYISKPYSPGDLRKLISQYCCKS